MEVALESGKYHGNLHWLRVYFLIAVIAAGFSCQYSAKKISRSSAIVVSRNSDTLRQYLALPESAGVKWLVRPRGVQSSRLAPGPTDYELFALVENGGPAWIQSLERGHAGVVSEMEEQPFDTAIANVLGLVRNGRGRIVGDKVYLTGCPFDADSLVKRPFSWGSGLVIDSAAVIRAVTF